MSQAPSYAGQQVVVLGGKGFIGGEVVRQVEAAGAICYAVGGAPSADPRHISGVITAELLATLPATPAVVIHVAGGASVARSIEFPRIDFLRSVSSTVDVLDYLRRHNPNAHLVYVSSAAVYGNSANSGIGVTRPCQPVSPYGLHKKICEEICAFYAQSYGLNISIVRPFSVYGPGLRKQLLWDALTKVDRRAPEFFGTGEELRDWVFVSDLAALLLRVGLGTILAPATSPIDAGTGSGVSVRNILCQLIEIYQPGMTPRFLGAEKEGDPSRLVAHASAEVRQILTRESLSSGLERYVRWYRSEARKC